MLSAIYAPATPISAVFLLLHASGPSERSNRFGENSRNNFRHPLYRDLAGYAMPAFEVPAMR